jgi:hypothetical protein
MQPRFAANHSPLLVPWVRRVRGYTSSPPMRQNWYVTGKLYLYPWQNEFTEILCDNSELRENIAEKTNCRKRIIWNLSLSRRWGWRCCFGSWRRVQQSLAANVSEKPTVCTHRTEFIRSQDLQHHFHYRLLLTLEKTSEIIEGVMPIVATMTQIPLEAYMTQGKSPDKALANRR